jgi:hypothetical protein
MRGVVIHAQAHLAVRAEARAQAAAGAGITGGRRGPTVRQGQGQTAWRARLETAGVGIAVRTSDDQDGPPEPGRPHNRRAFPPPPSNAGVVRQGTGRDAGPALAALG